MPGVCYKAFEVALFRAAFAIVFFGALHVGELVAQNKTDMTGRALMLGDVSFDTGCGDCDQSLNVQDGSEEKL